MQFYFAPLEGITGFAYRNAHRQFFGETVDKYFSPFAAPNYTHHFKTREREDIDPANNRDVNLVPQILTNRAGDQDNSAIRMRWIVSSKKSVREWTGNSDLSRRIPTIRQ